MRKTEQLRNHRGFDCLCFTPCQQLRLRHGDRHRRHLSVARCAEAAAAHLRQCSADILRCAHIALGRRGEIRHLQATHTSPAWSEKGGVGDGRTNCDVIPFPHNDATCVFLPHPRSLPSHCLETVKIFTARRTSLPAFCPAR